MEIAYVLILSAGALLSVGYYGLRKICPKCFSWNGLRKIYSTHDRTETRYRDKIEKQIYKDKYGNIIKTKEYNIKEPYVVDYYNVIFECKRCGHQVQKNMRSGKYLKETGVFFIIMLIILNYFFNPNKSDSLNKQESFDTNSTTEILNYDSSPAVSTNEELTQGTPSNNDLKSANSNLPPSEIEIEKTIDQVNKNGFIVTKDSPDSLKEQLAIEMLKKRKTMDDITNSTYLSKWRIRKLKRQIEKE